jgi:hypothetical protein
VLRRLDVQLGEDPADVCLDRLGTEPEGATDSLIGPALGNQSEDLAFAVGELIERVGRARAVDQLIEDVSIDNTFAGPESSLRSTGASTATVSRIEAQP